MRIWIQKMWVKGAKNGLKQGKHIGPLVNETTKVKEELKERWCVQVANIRASAYRTVGPKFKAPLPRTGW
jgi:hypothetical protein